MPISGGALRMVRALALMTAVAFAGAAVGSPRYAGSRACSPCHAQQAVSWRASHHALAMQPATQRTVRGDFTDADLKVAGDAARFRWHEGRPVVETVGPDGRRGAFEVTHTFGVEPLQQYLVALDRGRLQALPYAWDTRAGEQGGWYHLYPDAPPAPGDPLHWSGREQNWNHMCAACHATNLRKSYDARAHRYDTEWVELGVGCESCHGPGAEHAEQARAGDPASALPARLEPRAPGTWQIDPATGSARPSAEQATAEIEVCARCHARRRAIAEDPGAGTALLDSYVPTLLEADLYHADGQILGEVFEYGSFLQSRMYHAGVACSDCHEPHGLALRAEGDVLCLRCHARAKFATGAHHLHPTGSDAARCVACHMPARTYMRIDERRDHSLRVPRPDLSADIGVPNACNGCHAERSARWAAAQLAARHGPPGTDREHFASTLAAGRSHGRGATRRLAALANDARQPAIARATALARLSEFPGRTALTAALEALDDASPLVRLGALRALGPYPGAAYATAVADTLGDPRRAVRIEAGRLMAGVPATAGPALDSALAEHKSAHGLNADRPQAWLDLGNVRMARGDLAGAEQAFTEALTLAPDFMAASVNLADVFRLQGSDEAGERLLREALAAQSEVPELHHALGLLLVRTGRREGGVAEIAEAARLAPEDPHLAWVHGIALNGIGRSDQAREVLEDAQSRFPGDLAILLALATLSRDLGDVQAARGWAEALQDEDPADPRVRPLLRELPPQSR